MRERFRKVNADSYKIMRRAIFCCDSRLRAVADKVKRKAPGLGIPDAQPLSLDLERGGSDDDGQSLIKGLLESLAGPLSYRAGSAELPIWRGPCVPLFLGVCK